jgi:hypothetical protein
MSFGPWSVAISDHERVARLRSLRALANVFCHSRPEFIQALADAEAGDRDALARALRMVDQLPTIGRRRLLASYNTVARETRRAS